MTAQPLRHPAPAPTDAAPAPVFDTALGLRCRARAKAEGPAPALAELRAGLGPDARAWGPGGHALLPLAAAGAPGGAPVATLEFASGDLGVWRDERHRDGAAGPWTAGVLWIRLGLTEQLLRTAADYLAGRRVAGEVLAEVSSVRTMLGEAAADLVEARLLLEHGADSGASGREPDDGPAPGGALGAAGTDAGDAAADTALPAVYAADQGPASGRAAGPGTPVPAPAGTAAATRAASAASAADPGPASGRAAGPGTPAPARPGIPPDDPAGLAAPRAADALARALRTALRLLGASGYLDDGPGRLARAVDLLADVHPVAADQAAGHHVTEVSP